MTEPAEVPGKVAKHGKNALSKIPKPVLIGGAVAVVGTVYYVKKKQAANAAAAAANSTAPSDTPAADTSADTAMDTSGGGGYDTGYAAGVSDAGSSGVVSGTGTDTSELSDFSTLLGTLFPAGVPLGSAALGTTDSSQSGSATTPAAPTPSAAPAAGTVTVAPPAAAYTVAAPAASTSVIQDNPIISSSGSASTPTSACPSSYPHSGPHGCFKTAYKVINGKGYNVHTYQNGFVENVVAP